jgi:hypothetical protein
MSHLRILKRLVLKLDRNEIDIHNGEIAKLYDHNGNVVGKFEVIK